LPAATDFGDGAGHVATGDDEYCDETIRIWRAVIAQEAMIGLIHRRLERGIVQAAERRHAAGRQDHVHVHALDVHVLDARVRIDIDAIARKRRALPAHVPGCAFALLQSATDRRGGSDALPRAEATIELRTFADAIAAHTTFGGGALD